MSNLLPAWINSSALRTSTHLAENALYPLNSAFLQVSGPDAVKLLQGQLTADVQLINPQTSSMAAHCNAKGRMQSSFRLVNTAENNFVLRLHSNLIAFAQEQLHKYAVFSKVSLERLDDFYGVGLHGEKAKAALQTFIGSSALPSEDFGQIISQEMIIICTSKRLNSYEIYSSTATLSALWQRLDQSIVAYHSTQHQLVEYEIGLAFVEDATKSEFIPQMFNYQNTPAISFSKGCYTGQEIVARMHYLGANKRDLYRVQLTGNALTLGASLSLEPGKQSCGHIVGLVQVDERHWQALLVLTAAAAVSSKLYLAEQAVLLESVEAVQTL